MGKAMWRQAAEHFQNFRAKRNRRAVPPGDDVTAVSPLPEGSGRGGEINARVEEILDHVTHSLCCMSSTFGGRKPNCTACRADKLVAGNRLPRSLGGKQRHLILFDVE